MSNTSFSIERLDIKLNTEFVGKNFIFFDEVESTNSYLLKKSEGMDPGTVVFAEYQTKGRGRLNRTWVGNSAQNLYFSILLPEKKKYIEKINFVNLGLSLAVANSIDSLYTIRSEIKWPNDILINRKKIAGILLESISSGGKVSKIVAGIGVNVNQPIFYGEFSYPPTSLKIEIGEPVERERLLAEILNNIEEMLLKIPAENSAIIREWRNKCKMIGEKIEVTMLEKKVEGTFVDIDDNGFMLLRDRKGIVKTISVGDVNRLAI